MSRTGQNRKPRRRRSFIEPESQAVVEWLNNQTNLGTSLQVIVIDAINKYGKGDAVGAYFDQREGVHTPDVGVVVETAPKREKAKALAPEPIEQDTRKVNTGTIKVNVDAYQPTKQPDVTPEEPTREPSMNVRGESVQTKPLMVDPVQPKPAPEAQPVRQEAPVRQPEHSSSILEDDYDPIEVMMDDADARFES